MGPFVLYFLLLPSLVFSQSCVDDYAEPNNSLLNAHTATIGDEYSFLTQCNDTDKDFFKFVLDSRQVIIIYLDFIGTNTSDIDLFLLDQDGQELVTSGTPEPNLEMMVAQLEAGTYFVTVEPFLDGPAGIDTTLTADGYYNLTLVPSSRTKICFPDQFDSLPISNHNYRGSVDLSNITTQTTFEINTCNGQSDWFILNNTHSDFYVFAWAVSYDDSPLDVDVLLYKESLDIYNNTFIEGTNDTLNQFCPKGVYYLRLRPYIPYFGNYTFVFNMTYIPEPPSTGPMPDQIDVNSDNGKGMSSGAKAGVAVGVILLCLIILGGAIFGFLYMRKTKRKVAFLEMEVASRPTSPGNSAQHIPLNVLPPAKTSKFEIDYRELVGWEIIGKGSYGEVYKCKWRETTVAVKQLHDFDEKALEDFRGEAAIFTQLRSHPNVVLFLGITCPPQPTTIVTEFCSNGSLLSLIEKPEVTITTVMQIKILLGIARGMLHLHSENIIHRDLAARNVLLTEHMEPKISDFGLSRQKEDPTQDNKTKSEVGPLKWMAPEAIRNKTYSTKSDVYSYGIVMWELVARSTPYPTLDPVETALAVCHENLRPQLPQDCDLMLAKLMQICWATDPNARPSFSEICGLLKDEAKQRGLVDHDSTVFKSTPDGSKTSGNSMNKNITEYGSMESSQKAKPSSAYGSLPAEDETLNKSTSDYKSMDYNSEGHLKSVFNNINRNSSAEQENSLPPPKPASHYDSVALARQSSQQ